MPEWKASVLAAEAEADAVQRGAKATRPAQLLLSCCFVVS